MVSRIHVDDTVTESLPEALATIVELKSTNFDLAIEHGITLLQKHAAQLSGDMSARDEWRAVFVSRNKTERLCTVKEFDATVPKGVTKPTQETNDLKSDDRAYFLVEGSTEFPPMVLAELTDEIKAAYPTRTRLQYRPFISDGMYKLIVFPVQKRQFHEGTGETFYRAVAAVKPMEIYDAADLPEWVQVTGMPNGNARRYIFSCKLNLAGELKYKLIIDHDIKVSETSNAFSIEMDRSLSVIPNSLAMRVHNYRDSETVTAEVAFQEILKSSGQATWHTDTKLVQDVAKRDLGEMASFLQIEQKKTSKSVANVTGLGPVHHTDSPDDTIFISAGGAFNIATGEPVSGYVLSPALGKQHRQYGVSVPNTYPDMAGAYRTLARALDACPSNPAIPAALMGVTITAPLSTLNRDLRTIVYLHSKAGSGKTNLSKVFLSAMSPAASTHAEINVTLTLRTGIGSTTGNGMMQKLQNNGGFAAVVDDFIQSFSSEDDRVKRENMLSLVLGGLEGVAPDKMNWGRNGPEEARKFQPQASLIISGEKSVTKDSSNLRRIVELRGPDQKYENASGYDHNIINGLLTKESGGALHAAFSDMVVWSFQNPEFVAAAFERTIATVNDEWTSTTAPSERRNYAKLITGLRILEQRATDFGVNLVSDVERAIKELRSACEIQCGKTMVTPAEELALIFHMVRASLIDSDSRASITGPPTYGSNGDELQAWTDPFVRKDDQESNEEITAALPDFIDSRITLGLTNGGASGYVPRGSNQTILGYFVMPDSHNPHHYGERIVLTTNQLTELTKQVNKQLSKAKMDRIFTDREIRKLLLTDTEIASTGTYGPPPKKNKYRIININARALFATETDERDDQ